MKPMFLIIDILIRLLFTLLALYLLTQYNNDTATIIRFTGGTMLAFNLFTTFFDNNYHKKR